MLVKSSLPSSIMLLVMLWLLGLSPEVSLIWCLLLIIFSPFSCLDWFYWDILSFCLWWDEVWGWLTWLLPILLAD
jgi:hypothetical protein